MTIEAALENTTPLNPQVARTSRTFTQQAVVETLSHTSTWVGIAWIGLLVLAAVFAPFFASSYPLAVKQNGNWSSPLLAHLVPADAVWLFGFIAAMILAITRKVKFSTGFAIVLWIVALVVPLTMWPAIVKDSWLPGG